MSNESQSDDLIGYARLTQAALRGVMREVLKRAVAAGGLEGDHHFYITFRTAASGVQMADQLKDRFPDEMTIVIQHQYWDLEVERDWFEIVLKFGGVPQHLHIPFTAVTRFFDPAVNFGLTFDDADGAAALEPLAENTAPSAPQIEAPAPAEPKPDPEGTVVSLDAFRRK
ncbi:MAG: ClpXP protease specificity-enhancing factor SspB [Pseudomonadota bacterium]